MPLQLPQIALLSMSAAALLSACTPTTLNLEVSMSDELPQVYGFYPTLELDIAPVTAEEKQRLEHYDLEAYFEPNNALRRQLIPYTMKFCQDCPLTQDLDSGLEIWDSWEDKKSDYVAVLVNLPLLSSKEPGSADPRLLFLPFKEHFVYTTKDRRIQIGPEGVTRLTN